jgi:hypothetical protein
MINEETFSTLAVPMPLGSVSIVLQGVDHPTVQFLAENTTKLQI